MSAEELPDELDKLEIAPIFPTLKMADQNLPLRLNPFYDDLKTNGSSSETTLEHHTSLRLPSNCRRCRLRRRSESVLDEYKISATAQLGADYNASVSWNTRSPTPRLQRAPLKRSPNIVTGCGKKLLIREPVLRALQTCCARRKLLPNAVDDSNLVSGASSRNLQQQSSCERGMSDFRDLIQECQTLLEQDVTFNGGRLNQHSLSNKNFTTPRTPCGLKATYNEHSVFSGTGGNPSSTSLSLSSRLRTTSPTPLNEFNSFSAGANTSRTTANSGTSCSQQAGNANGTTSSNATGDDVTIDELASYFDTLVHIPKKMSTMAEMMYI